MMSSKPTIMNKHHCFVRACPERFGCGIVLVYQYASSTDYQVHYYDAESTKQFINHVGFTAHGKMFITLASTLAPQRMWDWTVHEGTDHVITYRFGLENKGLNRCNHDSDRHLSKWAHKVVLCTHGRSQSIIVHVDWDNLELVAPHPSVWA